MLTPESKSISSPTRLNSERVLSIVAHDLEGSARVLGSYAELLQERLQGQLDPTCERYAQHLIQGAQRLQLQLQALLRLSRIHEDESPLCKVDLKQAVAAARSDLELDLNLYQGEIECGALPIVRGRPQQLLMLFSQLFDNGIRYRSERPPRIIVAAEREGEHWKITVRDNGIGFHDSHTPRIFELFAKLPHANNADRCGAGLALAQQVALSHGGQLWASGNPGHGATFYLLLPV